MTKRELTVRIAKETGLAQEDTFTVIQKTLDYITEALVKGDRVEFRDFGVFELQRRQSRIGRNPKKPENVVRIPERVVVKFKAGRLMKQFLAKTPVEIVANATPTPPPAI